MTINGLSINFNYYFLLLFGTENKINKTNPNMDISFSAMDVQLCMVKIGNRRGVAGTLDRGSRLSVAPSMMMMDHRSHVSSVESLALTAPSPVPSLQGQRRPPLLPPCTYTCPQLLLICVRLFFFFCQFDAALSAYFDCHHVQF